MQRKPPAKRSSRMVQREVFARKAALLHGAHRQRISQSKHRGGACSWRKTQRARLRLDGYVQHDRGSRCKRGAWITNDGDNTRADAMDGGHKANNLVALATVGERKYDVVWPDNAEVAVYALRGMQVQRSRSG